MIKVSKSLMCKICDVVLKTESNLKQCDSTVYLPAQPPLVTTVSIWHTAVLFK